MAKEIIIQGTNLLTSLSDEWGGVNNTGAAITKYGTEIPNGYKWGMNFAEVERFIKSQFGDKVGYFKVENVDGQNYLLGFDSIETYQAWSADHSDPDHQPIVTAEMETHERYIARVATNSDTSDIITADKSHIVSLRFSALAYEGGEYVSSDITGTLTWLLSVDNGANYVEVGHDPIQSRDENSSTFDNFDIGKYLRDGYRNVIAVRASFTVDGETYTSRPLRVASVTYTSLSLVCLSDWHIPLASDDVVADGLILQYRASHAVDAVLHITVQGSNSEMATVHDLSASTSGNRLEFRLRDTLNHGLATHGVRKVTAWLSCDDGRGGTLRGNTLINRFMVIDAATAGANIDKPYLMIQNEVNTAENFMQTRICDLAVYSPDGTAVPLNIEVTSEAEDYPSGDYDVYYPQSLNAAPGVQYPMDITVEVEDVAEPTIAAYLHIWSDDDDILFRSIGLQFIYISVDNSQAFAPKAGASFVINPRLRNNTEETPGRIINAKNGNVVASSWEGFGFSVNDGWVKAEDGLRVLRVLAGQRLNIQYNPFAQFVQYPNSSMTFELDIKVRNVTDESTPVLNVSEEVGGRTRGLIIRAMSGNLFAQAEPNDSETNFRWQEGERTHIVINIHNQVDTDINGDGLVTEDYYETQGRPSTTRMFARVFINGDIEREILLTGTNAQEFCTGLMSNGGITIGQDNADIDIYSIRCYERMALDSKDVVGNYISTLPDSAQKRAVYDANNIMSGTRVDAEKVKALGKRVLILHGKEPYKKDTSASGNWWEIHQYDSEGNEIPELSGTICKETGFGEVKRQGSTANTYYYSNLQTKIDDAGTIDVRLEDIHESMTVSEPYEKDGVMVVDIYGGNLGKKDPVADVPKQYPINNGMVNVPDGWVDGNGKYRGMGFMIAEDTPLATKLVLKINYASSMQSHVTGCLKLYDDLHRAVVGENELQQRVHTARVSKYTEPVFFFTQLTDTDPVVFRGMGNFGAGKMDKPTWGYVKSEHPMFTMIEGSDNDQHLTDCRVPFATDPDCPECITYDPDEEGYFYGDVQNLDFDAGKTDDNGHPVSAITDRLQETWNWIYLHGPVIKRYPGTFADFLLSDSARDTTSKYWCSTGEGQFLLKRYDAINKVWRDAGLWNETNKAYGIIDLRTYGLTVSAYQAYVASQGTATPITLNQLNANFIAAIVADAKKYIGLFFNVDSLKFHYAFQNHFMAGTDNCSKNTYFVLMPYEKTVSIDGVSHQCYLWELHQDDVDTVLITDNNGRSTKPYYIDRMHPYSEDNPGESCYMGGGNNLFNLVEAMWETEGDGSEIASMLRRIFTAMVSFVTDEDVANGYTKTLYGCMQKYMLASQHYFPQMAYNEQARIRYEYPETLGYVSEGKGERHIKPITQSMGSQLQAETQFIKRRLLYMASYAAWGDFRGDNTYRVGLPDAQGTFGFEPRPLPNGNAMSYYLDVTPHQYIYPSGAVGQSAKLPRHRVAPGETWRLNIGTASGDTGVSLFAIHLYRSIGNVGDQSVNPNNTSTIPGNRMTSFAAEPTVRYDVDGHLVGAFRPNKLEFTAPLLRTVSLNGSGIGGTLDLGVLSRLVSLDLRGTYITELTLPTSEKLTRLQLPASLTKLIIDGQPNIGNTAVDTEASASIEGTAQLEIIRVLGNSTIASFTRQTVFNALGAEVLSLRNLTLDNINWTGSSAMPIALFLKMLDVPNVNISGRIEIAESSGNTVTLDVVNRILAKWPTAFDPTSDFQVIYTLRPLTGADIVCRDYGVNVDYLGETGRDYRLSINPNPSYANNIRGVAWSIDLNGATGMATIDASTGVLHVESLNSTNDTGKIIITATITTTSGTVTATRQTALYEHKAALGDLVYADGSYSDTILAGKTPIAVCVYINPDNPSERLAMSLRYLTRSAWGLHPDRIPNMKLDAEVGDDSTAARERCYDTQYLQNISTAGTMPNTSAYLDAGQDDGFARLATNTASGDIGFKTIDFNYGAFSAGDRLPAGVYNTVQIMRHRELVLHGVTIEGFSVNDYYPFAPEDGRAQSARLEAAMSAIVTAKGTDYDELYWPAAARCYVYQPAVNSGEVLDDKFKSGRWGLMSAGELARFYYWDSVAATSIFAFVKDANVGFETFVKSVHWSSTERSAAMSWYVHFNGYIEQFSKNQPVAVRAVVAF